MNALLEQARSATVDQTEDKGGNFSYEPPAEGRTVARLVGYIELGLRKQREYQGKAKPDAMDAFVIFELLGKKHAKEIEVNGVKKTVYPIHRERVTIKSGERAGFVKLLKAMDYGRGNTNMAQMLNEAFILDIVHNVKGDKTYTNIKRDGVWTVAAPVDFEGELVPVPDATVPLQLLLWETPSVDQWASIFIDGTRTKKIKNEDGSETEVEVSKNWIQNDIIENALNFGGSAVEAVNNEAHGAPVLDGGQAEAEVKKPAQPAEATSSPSVAETSASTVQSSTASVSEDDATAAAQSALGDLGL